MLSVSINVFLCLYLYPSFCVEIKKLWSVSVNFEIKLFCVGHDYTCMFISYTHAGVTLFQMDTHAYTLTHTGVGPHYCAMLTQTHTCVYIHINTHTHWYITLLGPNYGATLTQTYKYIRSLKYILHTYTHTGASLF